MPTLLSSDGLYFASPCEEADLLAREFQKVFTNVDDQDKDLLSGSDDARTEFSEMSPSLWFHREEISKIIAEWPNSYSASPDHMPLTFIKNVVDYIGFPLEYIFNGSYMRAGAPKRWKHAFVTPIPKKPLLVIQKITDQLA